MIQWGNFARLYPGTSSSGTTVSPSSSARASSAGGGSGSSAEAVAEEGALGAAQLGELVASPVARAVAQRRIIIVMPTTVAGPGTAEPHLREIRPHG